MEISRSGIVAKVFPEFQNLIVMGFRQSFHGWKPCKKTAIIGDDSFYLRLLEHHFGNPNGIRIACPTPRQIPGVTRVPSEQLGSDRVLPQGAFSLHPDLCPELNKGSLNSIRDRELQERPFRVAIK
jgi:hypothetical protein